MQNISELILAIIFTLMPVTELRVGLPLAVDFAQTNNLPIIPIFLLIVLINILLIVLIFLFLDFLHESFLKIKFYKKGFNYFLLRIRKKADKIENNKVYYQKFIVLALFVAVPLPGTGAWTGCLIAWLLDLERKRSIISISIGVIIAGLIILLASLGFFALF
ncbi:MAG: small multi-drug export protein [archaeon]